MTTTCPACGRESGTSWRCEYCGHDLVDEDDDDGSAAPPLMADGGRERGRGDTMERVTFRVPENLLEQFEDSADSKYPTRSEALREAMRAFVNDSGPDTPHTGSDERSFLRTDGGERVDPSGGRATHPRPQRFEGDTPKTRDAARERRQRREVESQQRTGQAVDQEPDDGRCPTCRGDVLPCFDCLLNGGDGRGE